MFVHYFVFLTLLFVFVLGITLVVLSLLAKEEVEEIEEVIDDYERPYYYRRRRRVPIRRVRWEDEDYEEKPYEELIEERKDAMIEYADDLERKNNEKKDKKEKQSSYRR